MSVIMQLCTALAPVPRPDCASLTCPREQNCCQLLLLLKRHHAAGGYRELLPVQTAAWSLLAGGHSQAHDLCLCAPTGSGKTLAYALPILQALARSAARCCVVHLLARCQGAFLVGPAFPKGDVPTAPHWVPLIGHSCGPGHPRPPDTDGRPDPLMTAADADIRSAAPGLCWCSQHRTWPSR